MAAGPPVSTGEPRERTPEEIRADLRATRDDMGHTLEQIEDRVSPTRIRQRQQRRWGDRFQRAREAVMGPPQAAAAATRDRSRSASEAVRSTPKQAIETTRGNPLAAGMIAFGAGALLGSLFPASEPEKQAAGTLRDRYGDDVRNEARHAAEGAKEELQASARHAADEVAATTSDAARRTRTDA